MSYFFFFYSLLLPCSQVPRLSRPLLLLQKKVRESSLSQKKKFQKRIGKKLPCLNFFFKARKKIQQQWAIKKISSNYSRPFFRPDVTCCNTKIFLNSVMQIHRAHSLQYFIYFLAQFWNQGLILHPLITVNTFRTDKIEP